ncbi:MAG: NAD(P)-dependent alcohol dehydrogenase [Rhodoferax sp.]|nr:NAD(P)-dependent alcohol dehydrogenase [Rhodoferax sp.]
MDNAFIYNTVRLVNGASGGVGTAAVQLAKHFGAHVTAVCSTGNLEMVRSIGADQVIDYTREDFTRSGLTFDLIVDTVGNAPFSRSGSALKPGGRLLMLVGGLSDLLGVPWTNLRSGKTIVAGPAAERVEYVQQLADLAAAGNFLPVIDRCYSFEQIVDAHRYVDQGRKRGNVCISVGRLDPPPASF